jgi:hypothetical protein
MRGFAISFLTLTRSSAETCRSRIPIQGTEPEHGIARTYPRGYGAALGQTALFPTFVCTAWVPARSREVSPFRSIRAIPSVDHKDGITTDV